MEQVQVDPIEAKWIPTARELGYRYRTLVGYAVTRESLERKNNGFHAPMITLGDSFMHTIAWMRELDPDNYLDFFLEGTRKSKGWKPREILVVRGLGTFSAENSAFIYSQNMSWVVHARMRDAPGIEFIERVEEAIWD